MFHLHDNQLKLINAYVTRRTTEEEENIWCTISLVGLPSIAIANHHRHSCTIIQSSFRSYKIFFADIFDGRQLSLRKCSFHDLFWRRKLWTNLILLKWKFLRIIIRHLILEMSTVVYNILRIQVTKICIFVLMFYSRLISFNTAGQRDQAGSLELLIVAFGLKMNPLYGNLCTS